MTQGRPEPSSSAVNPGSAVPPRSDSEAIEQLLLQQRLIICVGPGGVGKTTVAASLALRAAEEGRRVALLTIDPARRLADALGLDGLTDRLQPVEGGAGNRLQAAMLDTRTSYDSLIERITVRGTQRDAILHNRVYQSFSSTLARSHAYVAMERLHHVLASEAFDLVVLDTPPTRSALDILDAPGRLTRFLDEKILSAFVGDLGGGRRGWLKAKSTEVALKLLAMISGQQLLTELAGFFEVFLHLRQGFALRSAEIERLLRAPETSFLLIAAPESTHLADAVHLYEGLRERGIEVASMVFNRAGQSPRPESEVSVTERFFPPGDPLNEAALKVVAAASRQREQVLAQNKWLRRGLAAFLEDHALEFDHRLLLMVPELEREPADLDSLRELFQRLSPIPSELHEREGGPASGR